MLSTILSLFLVWVIYLWLDRHRSIHLKPTKLPPPYKQPTKPQFINSKTTAEISREEQRAKNAPSNKPTHQKQQQPVIVTTEPDPTTYRQVRVSTYNHLLRLVGHDLQMAKRLITHTRHKNPDKAEQWCWEKVIWDLERDRH